MVFASWNGHDRGVSAQGFRKHSCAFSLLHGGGLAQAPPETGFSLAVTPFSVSCCAVVPWLCSEPCPAPLLPWGSVSMGSALL